MTVGKKRREGKKKTNVFPGKLCMNEFVSRKLQLSELRF